VRLARSSCTNFASVMIFSGSSWPLSVRFSSDFAVNPSSLSSSFRFSTAAFRSASNPAAFACRVLISASTLRTSSRVSSAMARVRYRTLSTRMLSFPSAYSELCMVNGGSGETTTSFSPAASGTVTSRVTSAVVAYTVTAVTLLGAGLTSLSFSLSCARVPAAETNSAMPTASAERRGNMVRLQLQGGVQGA